MKVQTIASGSKGNSCIVLCENTNIIIDVGISYQTLINTLAEDDYNISMFTGILITHNHKDHIKGLKTLAKKTNIMIYIPEKMYDDIKDEVPKERCVFIKDNFNIGNIEIELIHTSHDAPTSVGYIIKENNKTLVYVTDTGYINRRYLAKMVGKDVYIIESNHDEKMLMDGPYPRFLKERVISDTGHLSNSTTAKYLSKIIGKNTKCIVLAHISEINNTENLAYTTTKNELETYKGQIIVAKQYEKGPLIEV